MVIETEGLQNVEFTEDNKPGISFGEGFAIKRDGAEVTDDLVTAAKTEDGGDALPGIDPAAAEGLFDGAFEISEGKYQP